MAALTDADRPRQAAVGAWVPGALIVLVITLVTGGGLGTGWPGVIYLKVVLVVLMAGVSLGQVLLLRMLLGPWRVESRPAFFVYFSPMALALMLSLIPVVGWVVGGALSVWVPMSWVSRRAARVESASAPQAARALSVTPIDAAPLQSRPRPAHDITQLPPPTASDLAWDVAPPPGEAEPPLYGDDEEGPGRPALW